MTHPIMSIFNGKKTVSIISVDSVHSVSLTGGKSNPMKDKVTKISHGVLLLVSFSDVDVYTNMIHRRLVKEGKSPSEYVPGKLSYGTRVQNSPFLEHSDSLYLSGIVLRSGKSVYYLDGVEIHPAKITGLPKPSAVSAESQGGLEHRVIYRNYKVDSILGMRAFGKKFVKGIDF